MTDDDPIRAPRHGADVALAHRLCRLSVDLLGAEASWTLLEDRDSGAFVHVADHAHPAHGTPAGVPWGAPGTVTARRGLRGLLDRLHDDAVAEGAWPLPGSDPRLRTLCMGLRHGQGVVGVQVAVRRQRFAPGALRLARLIADLGSLGFANELLRQQLQHAWHASTEYLANASDGLRTPLNVIIGYAEIARDRSVPGEEQERCIDHIARYATTLASVVDTLCRASSEVLAPLRRGLAAAAGGNGPDGGPEVGTPAVRATPGGAAEVRGAGGRDGALPWVGLRAPLQRAERREHDARTAPVPAAAAGLARPRIA